MLSRGTGDRWRSTRHRVLPPAADAPAEELISLIMFMEVDIDQIIEPFALPVGGDTFYEPVLPPTTSRSAPSPAPGAERLWIVDGTLIPVRDRKVAASSRNHRFWANVQVIIDAGTRLVVASARPAPGNKADAPVWRASGLPAVAAGTTVIADGAYLGTGLIVPHRRRAGRPLLRGQEEDNAEHRRVRARVEHTFARMKNWKILRDCRQRGDGLHHAVQAVATMHNLAMTG